MRSNFSPHPCSGVAGANTTPLGGACEGARCRQEQTVHETQRETNIGQRSHRGQWFCKEIGNQKLTKC